VRINLGSTFTYDVIAKGFAVNHGQPGSIFGPSGLAYDPNGDQLYIADGTNNTVVAFSNVSSIPNGGITVEKGGKTFKGPKASDARLVHAGKPLDGPISTALLFNGNLVVGNTGNPSGQNLLIELSPAGKVLDVVNVDKGASGSLFGIVATGSNASNTKLYFNDDNDNNLQVLER
jgi:DNA-binding beta-propeller fold protein YncE